MKTRRFFGLLISCLFVLGCLTAPAGAVTAYEPDEEGIIALATGQFEATIPANTVLHIGDSVSLDKGETVTYDCTYTPRSASVKFGYIGPDGLFCGIEGSRGSIDLSIRVAHRGSYTLAIWNKSNEAVTVKGTVNY